MMMLLCFLAGAAASRCSHPRPPAAMAALPAACAIKCRRFKSVIACSFHKSLALPDARQDCPIEEVIRVLEGTQCGCFNAWTRGIASWFPGLDSQRLTRRL